jgi:hypothetical protein
MAMQKQYGHSTRQYEGEVNTLNETLEKLPPSYNNAQKIPEMDMIDNLAILVPQAHKNIMIEQGFDPRTVTIEEYM